MLFSASDFTQNGRFSPKKIDEFLEIVDFPKNRLNSTPLAAQIQPETVDIATDASDSCSEGETGQALASEKRRVRTTTDSSDSQYAPFDYLEVTQECDMNGGDDANYESMSESNISIEDIEVKAEIEAMIESDLQREHGNDDDKKVIHFDEVLLDEPICIMHDSDDPDDPDERSAHSVNGRNVDSPASLYSTVSSRQYDGYPACAEFLNPGGYRHDFDVSVQIAIERPESPLNLTVDGFELEVCEYCADIFTARRQVSTSYG